MFGLEANKIVKAIVRLEKSEIVLMCLQISVVGRQVRAV